MEHQKIHPVDVMEAGNHSQEPTAPLVPRGSSFSDKGDPEAMSQFPPQQHTFPVSHSRPPKRRRGCCCRCICWSLCLLIVFIIALGITAGILYLIFRPKIPSYSVDTLRISNFTVDNNLNVTASFDVTITATNPNSKIGIYYVDGSYLDVLYSDASLCKGALPVFYQGHRNTTVLTVVLTGQTNINSNLVTELRAAQQNGAVPLVFKGRVPVKVRFGALKLWKMKFLVTCDVVVNSLSVNNRISIRSSHCRFRFRF